MNTAAAVKHKETCTRKMRYRVDYLVFTRTANPANIRPTPACLPLCTRHETRNPFNATQTFRLHSKKFYAKADTCCDLLICDEAHRLKNADTATNQVNTMSRCSLPLPPPVQRGLRVAAETTHIHKACCHLFDG